MKYKLKDITPMKSVVVLKVSEIFPETKEKTTEAGIILLDQKQNLGQKKETSSGETIIKFEVYKIGSSVDTSWGFKIGDEVMVDEGKVIVVEDDCGNLYGLCNPMAIKNVIEVKE